LLAGNRAGTTQIQLTNNENSDDVKTVPVIQVVPNQGVYLLPTQIDNSKMIYGQDPITSEPLAIAGSALTFKLRLTDANKNTIKSLTQNALIDFQFSGLGNGETTEKQRNTVPKSQPYGFVQGVTSDSFTVQVVIAGFYYLRVLSPVALSSNVINFGTGVIQPGSFDHYGATTFGPNENGSYTAHRDFLTKFSTIIDRRDAFGNVLQPDPNGMPNVNLSLRSVTDSTTGDLKGPTQNIQLSQTGATTRIDNLSYPEPCTCYIDVSDANGRSTRLISSSNILSIQSNLGTIAGYKIDHITKQANLSLVAGEMNVFRLYPIGRYGSVIDVSESEMNELRFTWSGAGKAPDSNQTSPILPSAITFNSKTGDNGQFNATFFKAETIGLTQATKLTITDTHASVGQSGVFPGVITVNPGPIYDYQITTCINGSNCDTSSKTRLAENSSAGYFDVQLATFDQWRNPRGGEAGLRLVAKVISGPVYRTSGFLSSSGPNAEYLADTGNINLRSGTMTFTNLYYPVGHTIEIDLKNGSVSPSIRPQIEFSYTEKSIANYSLSVSQTTNFAGANNFPITVSLLDKADNIIPTLDSIINQRTFRIEGPGYSPNLDPPTLDGGAVATQSNPWIFTNGVASRTLSLYKAERISSLAFFDSAGIEGRSSSAITVNENDATVFSVNFFGVTDLKPVAGIPFDIDVKTTDIFGNPSDRNCSAGVAVSGGTTSPGGYGGTETPPTIPAATKLAKGFYSHRGSILTKSGSQSLAFTACGVAQSNIQAVVSPSKVNRMVLKTTNSLPGPMDLGLTGEANSAELTCANTSSGSAATDCGKIYAFHWDEFGNQVDPAANICLWNWSNATATHGITITPPSNINGNGGSRTITSSDFVDGTLSCTRDNVTKSIKFWGGLAKLDATASFTAGGAIVTSDNIPAGTQIALSGISARTSKDGVLVTLPGAENSSTKQLNIASTLPIDGLPATANCTLVNSDCPTSYSGYLKTAGSAATISLSLHG
ncbi:hypothetical protein EBR21_09505, partial [bacterium]|nr:hypothetical protein [bacterium]